MYKLCKRCACLPLHSVNTGDVDSQRSADNDLHHNGDLQQRTADNDLQTMICPFPEPKYFEWFYRSANSSLTLYSIKLSMLKIVT